MVLWRYLRFWDIGNFYVMCGCYIVMDINGFVVCDSLN